MEVYRRIIPCLDVKDGRTVKGVNFAGMRDAGDPVELAAKYAEQGADELVLLDISATNEGRSAFLPVVESVAAQVNIPFTVGGGIASVETAMSLLRAGADKIAVNSSAFHRPELIRELAEKFGKQCVVVAVDVRKSLHGWTVHTHGGRQDTGVDALQWIQEAVAQGAGELLITSMDGDGTKEGFSLDLYEQVCCSVRIPVIASGGAGSAAHFQAVFQLPGVTGALAASIFHYNELSIPALKKYLKQTIRIR